MYTIVPIILEKMKFLYRSKIHTKNGRSYQQFEQNARRRKCYDRICKKSKY
jgi:hypothetical protein